MDSVQCVSLPRSGHNLLVQHLQKYFQSNEVCLSVPKSSKNQISRAVNSNGSNSASRQKFHYCEYYYACRERPCCCSQNCFQKSHDFDLSQPVLPGQKYLVQTRAPLGLLISWFEMRLLKKREKDSAKGFNAFEKQKKDYINGFIEKWVSSPMNHRIVLDYNEYLDSPAIKLAEVIQFFDESHTVDHSSIASIVKDVNPAKDNSRFRFYEAALNREVAA